MCCIKKTTCRETTITLAHEKNDLQPKAELYDTKKSKWVYSLIQFTRVGLRDNSQTTIAHDAGVVDI